MEFFKDVKNLEFKSKEFFGEDLYGNNLTFCGIKVVKSRKEEGAGEPTDQE